MFMIFNVLGVKVFLSVFSFGERQCPLCEVYVSNDIRPVLWKYESSRMKGKSIGIEYYCAHLMRAIDKINV